jgi:hypothetical protein
MGIKPGIIIHRTRPRAAELMDGVDKLDRGQWGFATEEETIVLRDLEDGFYFVQSVGMTEKMVLIKTPVQDYADLPAEDEVGTVKMVLGEQAYYFKSESGWKRFGADHSVAGEFEYRNSVVALKDDYEIPAWEGPGRKEAWIGQTYCIVSDSEFPIRIAYKSVGNVDKSVRIASGTYVSLTLLYYNEDSQPVFAIAAALPPVAEPVPIHRLDIALVSSNPSFQHFLEEEAEVMLTNEVGECFVIPKGTKRIEIPQGTYSVTAACDGFDEYGDDVFDLMDMATLECRMEWLGCKFESDYEEVEYEIEGEGTVAAGERILLAPGVYSVRAIGSEDYLPDADRGRWNNFPWQEVEVFQDSNIIKLNPIIWQPIAAFEVLDDVTDESLEFLLFFKEDEKWVLQESHEMLLSEEELEYEYRIEAKGYAPTYGDLTQMSMEFLGIAFEGSFKYSNTTQTSVRLKGRSVRRVRTASELQFLGEWAVGEERAGEKFLLDSDIDLKEFLQGSDKGFVPIGTCEKPFMGEFDGQGHSIGNLMIYAPEAADAGLFGVIENAVIENLTVVDNS